MLKLKGLPRRLIVALGAVACIAVALPLAEVTTSASAAAQSASPGWSMIRSVAHPGWVLNVYRGRSRVGTPVGIAPSRIGDRAEQLKVVSVKPGWVKIEARTGKCVGGKPNSGINWARIAKCGSGHHSWFRELLTKRGYAFQLPGLGWLTATAQRTTDGFAFVIYQKTPSSASFWGIGKRRASGLAAALSRRGRLRGSGGRRSTTAEQPNQNPKPTPAIPR